MRKSDPGIHNDRIITSADTRDDVAQILYGLSLRGVKAVEVENEGKVTLAPIEGAKVPRFLILIEKDNELQWQIAQDSIQSIWDAILEQHPRAVTPSGHCSFCGYDVEKLPRPTICPECGVDIDSIAARRVVRARRS